MRQLVYMAVWIGVCALVGLFGSVLLGLNFYVSFFMSSFILIVSAMVDQRQKHVPDKFFTPLDIGEPPRDDDAGRGKP